VQAGLMKNDGIHSLLNADVVTVPGAPSQGARRATEAGAPGAARAADPEVVATAKRRRFSGSEKRRILAEADACTKPGELGALLRREGVYSSMLATWRKQRDRANEAALEPRRRGRKPDPTREDRERLEKLKRENARLQRELTQARLIIDVQKKVSSLLGIPMQPEPTDEE
jgi:transposase